MDKQNTPPPSLSDILDADLSDEDMSIYHKDEEKKDRVGLLGNWGVLGVAALIGYTSVGAFIATASGSATFLGSEFLGSALGSVVQTNTPWIFGVFGTLVSAAIAYLFIKCIRSGQHYDTKKDIRRRDRELQGH